MLPDASKMMTARGLSSADNRVVEVNAAIATSNVSKNFLIIFPLA
jgi:hypothetical protein